MGRSVVWPLEMMLSISHLVLASFLQLPEPLSLEFERTRTVFSCCLLSDYCFFGDRIVWINLGVMVCDSNGLKVLILSDVHFSYVSMSEGICRALIWSFGFSYDGALIIFFCFDDCY
jgi:hypothetical protein